MAPIVMITRPEPEATALAAQLAGQGARLLVSPLQQIRFHAFTLPEAPFDAIFTSRNGVRAYADLGGPDLPAICVGEATAQAARDIGLPARAMGGDSDALIAALLADRPEAPVMHLRGEVSRGDIATRLTAGGIVTRDAVIYRQTLLDLTDAAHALLMDRRPVILPLYSPRTAARLAQIIRPRAPLHVVAISQAVAKAAAPLGAENKVIADTPDAPAMIRAVLATLRRVEGMGPPH